MSKLIVEICHIKEIKPHPNADRLEIAQIKGWEVVIKKDSFHPNDLIVFIPPDTVLPESWHSFLEITQYCAQLPKNPDGSRPTAKRVKATRIRGVPSYGTIMSVDNLVRYNQMYLQYSSFLNSFATPSGFDRIEDLYNIDLTKEGINLANILGFTKWEPPIKSVPGDTEKDHPLFHKYTNIENWRNYPDIFKENEEVVLTEKIHGCSNRLGLITVDNKEVYMAGSHKITRKKFDNKGNKSLYWEPFDWFPQIKNLLYHLYKRYKKPVIIFGEIFGSKIQDLTYGFEQGQKSFKVFDISINSKYIDYEQKLNWCLKFEIPIVPTLYVGPYSYKIVEKYTSGPTTVCDDPKSKFKGREGCVITPTTEKLHPILGRVILKSINVDYLDRKNPIDNE